MKQYKRWYQNEWGIVLNSYKSLPSVFCIVDLVDEATLTLPNLSSHVSFLFLTTNELTYEKGSTDCTGAMPPLPLGWCGHFAKEHFRGYMILMNRDVVDCPQFCVWIISSFTNFNRTCKCEKAKSTIVTDTYSDMIILFHCKAVPSLNTYGKMHPKTGTQTF